MYDSNEWWRLVMVNGGTQPRDELLTLMRYYSSGLSQLNETLRGGDLSTVKHTT